MYQTDPVKKAYVYENQFSQIAGFSAQDSPWYLQARSFLDDVRYSNKNISFDDFLNRKTQLSEDRIGLIMGEVSARERLKFENLNRLYEEIFMIDKWRTERPFPENYAKDKIWSDLNKMEMDVREKIRRELKDFSKDASFPQKDLRESLLEFKLQDGKARMMESGLEAEMDAQTDFYR